MRFLVLSLALGLTASFAASAGNGQYVFVVNDSPNTVVSLRAIAADGTVTDFKDVPMKGSDNGYVRFLSDSEGQNACMYTVEATFNRGEPLKVVDYNACKTRSLHLGSALRRGRLLGG